MDHFHGRRHAGDIALLVDHRKLFRVDLVRHANPLDLVAVADEDRFDDSHIHRRANGLQRVRILRIGYRQFFTRLPLDGLNDFFQFRYHRFII